MTAGRRADPDWGRDFGRAQVPLAAPNPALVLWRWRWELAALGAVALAATESARLFGWLWTLGSAVCLVSGLTTRPTARRVLRDRAFCVITQHRVRTGCAHAWVQSRSGKLPAVMWTSAQPYGERVVLWCRAGTTAEDLDVARPVLAAACWARDVLVVQHPTYAHVVALLVVRREVGPAGT